MIPWYHPDNDVTASRLIGMKGIWKRDSYYDRDFAKDGRLAIYSKSSII
ncbi:hypothetical protein [Paenibacillus sp. HGF5]|nr:hypothetical protein [Paenibacillus sp. HGF5]